MPRKILCVLIVLGLLPFVVSAAEVKNPDTFVYAISGEVDSLDPDWAFDAISQEVSWQIYETLIAYKGAAINSFEPILATAVPDRKNGFFSEDGLEYRFPLRKNIFFHDGTPMTADDVKYSLMRFLLTDRAGGPSYLLLEPLLGVNSTQDEKGKLRDDLFGLADQAISAEGNAVVLRLQKPYAPLLSILAAWAPVVSKKWVIAHGGWDGTEGAWKKLHDPAKNAGPLYDQANGTGPFKLERWDKQAKQVILARNENYWRAPARLKRVVFKTVDEPNTRKLMLQTGDADAAVIERQNLPQVEGMEGISIFDDLPLLEVHNVFIYPFKINIVGNPYVGSGRLDGDGIPTDFFADLDVRKGLAYAFDYEGYIRDGYRGKGRPARGPIPYGVFGYNPRQSYFTHNPERAKEHFRHAFGGELWDAGFRFTMTYMEGAADRKLACEIMKKNVESLNPRFRIDVRGIQWSTWLANWSTGKIPMANARWHLDYPDPHNAVYPFLSSNGYYASIQGYSNPRADRYIEEARREPDLEKRRQMYSELQAIASIDVPQIYTLDTYQVEVRRSWVKGWIYNPMLLYGYLYPVYKE
jgi:peptide/nickel transport system substrate-binding protein